jgi:hypothetical protein
MNRAERAGWRMWRLLRRGEYQVALGFGRATVEVLGRRAVPAEVADQLGLRLPLPALAVVDDCPLRVIGVTVAVCIARQVAGDRTASLQRSGSTSPAKRGRDCDEGECNTERCLVGRAIRTACGDGERKGRPRERPLPSR